MSSCNWTIDESCLPALPDEDESGAYEIAAASLESAIDAAIQVLWALSGRQFCLRDTVIRPCPEQYPPSLRRPVYPLDAL